MNVNDNINMEYESRVMIDEILFNKIKNFYLSNYPESISLTNHNFYFDTEDLFLTKNHVVLRVRCINDCDYELTLKVKGEKGDIELNHHLKEQEAKKIIKDFKVTAKIILEKLKEYPIDLNNIKLITDLKTERIEFSFPNYLFVIDKNYYRGRVDYNLEVEASSKKEAKKYLKDICKKFAVSYKKDYISKSKRAIYNL